MGFSRYASHKNGGDDMETFEQFIETIDNPEARERTERVLNWVAERFPQLKKEIKWNQPMFTDHETFIAGFSVAKKHLAFAPEEVAMQYFEDEIEQAGLSYTKGLIRFPWNAEMNYELLGRLIEFNIIDKANCTTFWRK